MTYTHYTGQARRRLLWRPRATQTRREIARRAQVCRTRWHYVSGEVDHFFDDVLVCASRSLPGNLVTGLEPWDLAHIEGFQPPFLSGFKTERYVVTLPEGFATAKQIMDSEISTLCCRDLGGDHQRLDVVSTQHVGVTGISTSCCRCGWRSIASRTGPSASLSTHAPARCRVCGPIAGSRSLWRSLPGLFWWRSSFLSRIRAAAEPCLRKLLKPPPF